MNEPSLTPIHLPDHIEFAICRPAASGRIKPSSIHAVSRESHDPNLDMDRQIGGSKVSVQYEHIAIRLAVTWVTEALPRSFSKSSGASVRVNCCAKLRPGRGMLQ
jgi:hypothetical protein